MKASLILLAGGKGLRMGGETPKQFIEVEGKFIAEHALDPFLDHLLIDQIVIVCDSSYRNLFDSIQTDKDIVFVDPGVERQHSLLNGLSAIKGDDSMVIVHDAARPFINRAYIEPLITQAHQHGAAILGVRAVSTLKQASSDQFVTKTVDRSTIWEIQTPQVAPKQVLLKGLAKANEEHLMITDEASLLEGIGFPVKIVEGDSLNFKVTSKTDIKLMQSMLKQNAAEYV